ncbi:hypothetical protein [Pyxidicoccus sp. MSG2]|uniref:hypothetical protein n=1 Tax=Pyxidicoccus sp. MSG2 TaxID=2996790 RepID=UPI0022715154|nr:hypothetical protein [Pyxidicoccus sp. MSG2]MCY1014646.1 hypothetical protein [Pyxidicoccus sp. MSG2]
MKEGSEGAQLAPEWRRWVVENLLRGADAPDLVAVLEGAGVDAALAREAVEAELKDPCFEGTRKALALDRKLEGLLDMYGELYRQAEGHERVDRHESLSGEEFFDRYYFQNRPVVIRGSVVDPASEEDWRPERLMASGARAVSLVEHADLRPLLESLRPPVAYVVADARAGRPVLSVEAEGFQSEEGAARENVLLCQVHGRRRLRLVPAFELRRMTGEPEEKSAVPRLEVELGPGDLALVSVGWWFAWRVLEASTSVSFSAFAASAPNVTWEQEPAPPEPTPPPWRKRG